MKHTITEENQSLYQYTVTGAGGNIIFVAPHELLRPYISNYTFTFPRTMLENQMVLPSASSTLVYAIGNGKVISGLRSVNTKPTTIGRYARQFDFMFLIEFHPAGLYPFLKINQNLLVDNVFAFEDMSKLLNQQITEAYYSSKNIDIMKHKLDRIFLSKLDDNVIHSAFVYAMKMIVESKGVIRIKALAQDVYYSEKQLNRLFQKYVGTGVKTFSRIVRMKRAVDLLNDSVNTASLFETTGHYDYSHFAHDFKALYGITPKEYISNMSLFYNDPFKL